MTAGTEVGWWIAAAVCFSLFALLGAYVSRRTPTRLDIEAVALRGDAPALAGFFTMLGRWPALTVVLAGSAFLAALIGASPLAVAGVALSQALSQTAVSVLKRTYRRTRPDYWLVRREADLSFPSGHAVTAMVTFLALAIVMTHSRSLPRPAGVVVLAAYGVCVVGIPWSRLARGAHYATDVLGGLLFGAGWWCATVALLLRFGRLPSIG